MMKKTVELLKIKVKENLQKIKENQAEIQVILRMPNSQARTDKFNKKYNINRELIAENNESINLEVSLLNYLKRFDCDEVTTSSKLLVNPSTKEDIEEIFFRTAMGQMEFDEVHPCFNDEKFFTRLMDFYLRYEEYEKCQQLTSQKEIKSINKL